MIYKNHKLYDKWAGCVESVYCTKDRELGKIMGSLLSVMGMVIDWVHSSHFNFLTKNSGWATFILIFV